MLTKSVMEDQQPSEWVISMKEKLKKAQEYASDQPWEKWSIYRVPRRLRDAQDNKVYVPQTVSIGPFHHADEQVRSMDRQKWIALYRTLERTGHDLNMYLNAIKEVENYARACYQQDLVHLSSNEFIEMMVLDGCFILELFHCSPKVEKCHDLEAVIFNRTMIDDILMDMVMMENQIPLFILDRLLEMIYMNVGNPNGQHREQAAALALNLFNPEWITGTPISTTELEELKSSFRNKKCLHILDVFRQSLLHQEPQQNLMFPLKSRWQICDKLLPGRFKKWYQSNIHSKRKQTHRQVIHKVTELRESGIKFKKRSTNHFWDIKFNKGVIEIPSIWIQDGTMSILLNLAAFEHCHLNITDSVIASYAIFMECLIKSPEDVSYLHRHGIIQHLLGHDGEVVNMFKSVSKEMLTDAHSNRYAKLAEEVNAYCYQRRNKWRASLIHNYFNNPWAIISLVAAFILLMLTATQTIYAVYSFYSPTSGKNGKQL
ncbi:UPF0481 protein At3g47200-like [Silene latifolia]|uniref:UPF0481 protein At3g47200-like n=1 Tax=Silene latifolia TaxID=37657 RepID=UPI003D77D0E9